MRRAWRVRRACAVGLLSGILLSACGGGGDGGGTPTPTPVPATAIPDTLSISGAASSDVASATAFSNSAAALQGLSFVWNFGDGSSSTEASPKHDYAKVGDYEVSLKVSNTAGASKEVKFQISVNNRAHVRGLACSGASDSGWCWQQPRPTGTSREDYFFLDAQTGWSVGDNGEILKTSDGGKTWVKQDSGVRTRLWAVVFADANHGWVLGAHGALLRTVNGGQTWTMQAVGFNDGYDYGHRLDVIDAQTALVSSNHKVRRTTDGGATWTEHAFALGEAGPDGTLWSFAGNTLKKSVDGGATATVVPSGASGYSNQFQLVDKDVLAISDFSSNYDYTLQRYVYKLLIWRSLNGGASWESYEAQGLAGMNSYGSKVDFIDANKAYLVSNGQIYRSVDGGRNWTQLVSPPSSNWNSGSAQVLDDGVLYRQTYHSAAEHHLSEDGGVTWNRIAVPTTQLGNDVQRLGAKAWLSIQGDNAYLSTDGMLSWRTVGGVDPQVAQRSMVAAWFFDAKRGLGLNASGELQETVNGGTEWTVKIKNLATPAYGASSFQFISASKGWLLAGDGKVYRSTDGGASWATPLAGRISISAFHFVDENNGYALARDYADNSYSGKSVLLTSTDGGLSWSHKADMAEGLTGLQFASPSKGLVIGQNGRILSTDDGGKTWTARFSGTGVALNRVVFTDASTAWVVGGDGTLLKSGDAGASWTRVLLATNATLSSIRFLDAQQGWIAGSNGTILLTRDGGKTWTPQFSGTQKALNEVFFVDGRTGWALGVDGAILSTGTGGI